ncbi:unknown protein [Waddlia chondrophila 2032/99]|uniref:Shikimate kinase n=1 Tax=Waddlia chondrophila 2032/99 TaxID=765953 RepID=F8LBM3_9BACT|nr:unknown protein [Waddlia chondrophila 2032/99]
MNRSTNSKIVLIGYRGVGKTTLGKALADTLKRPFIDTDDLIVQAANAPYRKFLIMKGNLASA